MKFVRHPNHTLYMNAPRNWNEERDGPCGALSILDRRGEPLPYMESAWELEALEPLLLALGVADIRLAIYNYQHPPVSMVVHPKSNVVDRGQLGIRLKAVLCDLAYYAKEVGFNVNITPDGNGGSFVGVIDTLG